MTFAHIGIKVTQMAESIKFYTEVLDCTILKEDIQPATHLVFLNANGTILELIFKEENLEREMGPIEHIAFKVESLDGEIALLERKGITVTEPRIVGANRICFFDGPNHERIEFMETVQ